MMAAGQPPLEKVGSKIWLKIKLANKNCSVITEYNLMNQVNLLKRDRTHEKLGKTR